MYVPFRAFGAVSIAGAATFAVPALAQPLGSDSAACAAGNQPAILANIHGMKDRAGRIKIEIYPDNEDDFLKRDDDLIAENKVFRRVWADPPQSGPVSICIRVPRPGRYAVVFTHQRESKKKFNVWVDGVGLPSDRRIGRSRPKVDQALVNVGPSVLRTDIRVQYMRGLGGFGPTRSN